MNKDRDWKKVFHKKFVQHYMGADSYNFHGFGDDAPYEIDGTEEVDKVIDFIEQEKKRSYEEGYYRADRRSLAEAMNQRRTYEEGYKRAEKDMAEGKLPVEFRH